RIGERDRGFGLFLHPRLQRAFGALVEASGIGDGELAIAEPPVALAAVAGDAGFVIDQHKLLPDQPVEQRRFSDIGPADDGDREGHTKPVRPSGRACQCNRKEIQREKVPLGSGAGNDEVDCCCDGAGAGCCAGAASGGGAVVRRRTIFCDFGGGGAAAVLPSSSAVASGLATSAGSAAGAAACLPFFDFEALLDFGSGGG